MAQVQLEAANHMLSHKIVVSSMGNTRGAQILFVTKIECQRSSFFSSTMPFCSLSILAPSSFLFSHANNALRLYAFHTGAY